MTDQYRAITEPLVAHSNARYGRALYSTHVVMRERYCANLISLALCACQAADHPVERHDLLNRQASVDGRKNALRIIGIEPMIACTGMTLEHSWRASRASVPVLIPNTLAA